MYELKIDPVREGVRDLTLGEIIDFVCGGFDVRVAFANRLLHFFHNAGIIADAVKFS